MSTLERRIEALEQAAGPSNAITLIAVQLVRAGALDLENRSCKIDGETHSRRADETVEEFDARMVALANELNKRRGKPVQIILSPEDVGL